MSAADVPAADATPVARFEEGVVETTGGTGVGTAVGRAGGGARLTGSRSNAGAETTASPGRDVTAADARDAAVVWLGGGGGGGGSGRAEGGAAGADALPYHVEVPPQALLPPEREKSHPATAMAASQTGRRGAHLSLARIAAFSFGMYGLPFRPDSTGVVKNEAKSHRIGVIQLLSVASILPHMSDDVRG